MIHTLADEFAAQVQQLCATTVSNDQWAKFLDVHVPRVDVKGEPLKGRSLTMAYDKRDGLQKLYRHDNRVSPWAVTAQGVLQAVINTAEHHEGTIRGATRTERNMLRTVSGDFGVVDRQARSQLAGVLSTERAIPPLHVGG